MVNLVRAIITLALLANALNEQLLSHHARTTAQGLPAYQRESGLTDTLIVSHHPTIPNRTVKEV